MVWVLHCDCGTKLTGTSEREFVENVFTHARNSHNMTMTREQALALATVEGDTPSTH
jgi:predicted small metal-binding protein